MEKNIYKIKISKFVTENGNSFNNLQLSYQLFGKKLGTAPVVMVNHALTGNSDVAGTDGWWAALIGDKKAIDTQKYTILAFNIPGNGFDGFLIEDYKNFIACDVAKLFLIGLKELKISQVFVLIAGSLGGGIAWEMLVLNNKIAKHFIPVATDWKSTDWLIANCQIQEQFLVNSSNPVHDARMHAMLCYRTPESFKERFQRSKNNNKELFNVESWLLHHGEKLQERYQLSSYKLMNQLLKTIDVTQNGKKNIDILDKIEANIHIIGVDSDLFFTAEENKETYKNLALKKENVTYNEINSVHGHDAFLIEYEQLQKIIAPIFNQESLVKQRKIVKFGNVSLANGKGINNAIEIISSKIKNNEKIVIVVSPRGETTKKLLEILEKSRQKKAYSETFQDFKNYQLTPNFQVDFSKEFSILDAIFKGVSLLGDASPKVKAEVIAQGVLLSVKMIASLLKLKEIKVDEIDARTLMITDDNYQNTKPNSAKSKENVVKYFNNLDENVVPVYAGFIASNLQNETTILGENGGNLAASLLANYLNAEELQNYTHLHGIFTADPDLVENASKIEELSFTEANEIAKFGNTILNAKSVIPLLEKNINLRIFNTFNKEDKGTLITTKTSSKGIQSISVLDNLALLNFEGRGLLGRVGVDARIFNTLSNHDISVSIISQGSSERGVGMIIDKNDANRAVKALQNEFKTDFYAQDVNQISIIDEVSVISIIGQDLSEFHLPYHALIKNNIVPILFNNTISGKNVNLVIKKQELRKAVNVLHQQVFDGAKASKNR